MSGATIKHIENFFGKTCAPAQVTEKSYLTLKLPLEIDEAEAAKLRQVSAAIVRTWNTFTEEQRKANWRLNYYDIKKKLPLLKREMDWLKNPSSQVLQEVAKSHAAATKGCLTKRSKTDKVTGLPLKEAKANFPGFKATRYFQSHKYPQKGISFELEGATLKLAYGKSPTEWIVTHLPAPLPDAEVKAVTVTYDKAHQRYYACLETLFHVPVMEPNGHVLVVDPGCKTAMTCLRSDGTVWEYDIADLRTFNMKLYKAADELMSRRDVLPCAQLLVCYRKEMAKLQGFVGPLPAGTIYPQKPKTSKEYRRLDAKIRSIFKKIRNVSKQCLHVLAKKILKDHPQVTEIAVGDWSKQETTADTPFKAVNAVINRAVQNNNPIGKLIEYLSYKAVFKSKQVTKFDERGTTKTCSHCNYIGPTVPTSQRTFSCRRCAFKAPRDINATLNQMKYAFYGAWRALRSMPTLSIVRTKVGLLSCEKTYSRSSEFTPNYGDARGL